MGTNWARRRKDGSTGYTAQIRVTRDEQRARGEALGMLMTVGEMAAWYELRASGEWSRKKLSDIRRIKVCGLADRRVDQLTRRGFIAHIEARRSGRHGRTGLATAANDRRDGSRRLAGCPFR